jgi:asparagine synthase (glutamine-hydrolysing)
MGSFTFRMAKASESAPCLGTSGWVSLGPCSARIANDGRGASATLVQSPTALAAGLVRIDNRGEISRLAQCDSHQSDLAIVVAALARHGETSIQALEGDFAFAYWDNTQRQLIVARDALGVRILYQAEDPREFAFSSHAGHLGADRQWSLEYFADFIGDYMSKVLTPYTGVMRFAPATYQVVRDRRSTMRRYWSPHQFSTTWKVDSRSAVEHFTTLFTNSLRACITNDRECWSQLSGGVDSSSIVSMACRLARTEPDFPRLGGTVTLINTFSRLGDERTYSDVVVKACGVRNEQYIDPDLWEARTEKPPLTDVPDGTYPLFARDLEVCRTIRASGGRVLLTGIGPDHYLYGDRVYFADWIANGRVAESIREMYRLAVLGRISFWQFTYRNAVRPFVERPKTSADQWPAWVHPSFASRFPIADRGTTPRRPSAMGRHLITHTANQIDAMEHGIMRGVTGESLDIRNPYLSRPLVEFSLQLPPEMLVEGRAHKHILREAMRGILPEEVRRRLSKGFVDTSVDDAFVRQHGTLHALLERSILGDMGCIDVRLAQKALSLRTAAHWSERNRLRHMLTLESWLAAKSGQWTASEPIRPVFAHRS